MHKVKKFIKVILYFCISIIIPVIKLIPSKKINKNILKIYEKNIKALYNPSRYKYIKNDNMSLKSNIDLSIIIPVYNTQKFVKKCIDSILQNKTSYNFEILIINDGSTDDSMKILKSYYNNRKIRIIDQSNHGLGAARNKGLNLAIGKYVSFIDSDDYITDNYIECLMSKAIENNADIVKCGYYYYYDNNGAIKKWDGIELACNNQLNEKVFKINGFAWGCVIKRKLLYDIRFPDNYWYEDMIVRPLILARCTRFIGIKDCLYFYRQHANSITKQVGYKSLSQFYLPRYIYNYCMDGKIKVNYLKEILFKELQSITYIRCRKFSRKIQKEVFYLNCTFFRKLQIQNIVSYEDKLYAIAFTRNNYILYKLLSLKILWRKNIQY